MSEYELPEEARRELARVEGLEARARHALAGFEREAERRKQALHAELARVEKEIAGARGQLDRDREVFDALREDKLAGFELIGEAWADYELAIAKAVSEKLRTKGRPAQTAAREVAEKGRELAKIRRELKRSQWVLALYETHFPWLAELRALEEEQAYVEETEAEAASRNEDPVGRWLSAEEYKAVPEVDRNQRALDRYLKSHKSAWQIGRDYERYIGYLRERDGATVTYQGIFAGLEDLGRDLLAEDGGRIEVIQCKHWAKRKMIHEKHVFQLYGTVIACRIENPGLEVTATFTTTTSLSERARQFAEQLDVKVEENVPLADYPRIKCNISRAGERIYHLPFDQQYDTTVIEPDRGECYAATCADAEKLGYRRAWRWRGSKQAS